MHLLRAACASLILLALLSATPGCSLFSKKEDKAGRDGAKPPAMRAQYSFEVEAPRALQALLKDNLDLARVREVPGDEALSTEEIDRLVAAAPEQVRALLATEGYFSPTVQARREPVPRDGLPHLVVQVEPGPRTEVDGVLIQLQGELQQRADAGDDNARDLLAGLRREWPLKSGQPFRQADWTHAKDASLSRLHTQGYPAATWVATEARVRSKEQRVDLQAQADSGALFHLGEMRIEGLQRYPQQTVRNLATFAPGTPYSEQRLLDFQERLQRSGLFEGAVAQIDPDPARAAATPVTVRVREQKLQKAVLGLGYDSDTGARATIEHTHLQPFGLHWTALDKLELGPQRKAWDFDFRSYPRPGFERNLVGGTVERWSGPDEERYAWRLRTGRAWEDPRLERQVYAEYNNARVRTPQGAVRDAQSLTGHYDWTRRDVDSLLLPTRGAALVLQGAGGYARSSSADNGPFARGYARALYFKPFARDWHAQLRLEMGQVFARPSVGVPDTLLFRAGGQDSVRGYEYRSLGPVDDGVVSSGRSLLTASAEVQRPLSRKLPQLWGAAFVDAGNAAQRLGDLQPKVGVGVGVRYRSPLGPLSLDLAYGVDARQARLHLSAGVSF